MKVQEQTLGGLFQRKKTYCVPPFQRRYTWKEENFYQLWEDIKQVMERSRRRHFMGTVVFQPDGQRQSVIDGQQRLITFTVLLVSLLQLSSRYADGPKGEMARLLKHALYCNGLLRLVPSLPDRLAFVKLQEGAELLGKYENRNIKSCYNFFVREVQAYIDSDKRHARSHFKEVVGVILNQLVFVEIVLSQTDDVHAIFETINYAGEPLTPADLVRNLILGRSESEEEQHRFNIQYWQPLEDMFESNLYGKNKQARKAELQKVLPEFLRAVLIVECGRYVNTADLFRELRKFFHAGAIEEKLKIIQNHAIQYCKLLNPELESRKGIQRQLQQLFGLKMTTYNPVLLILLRAHACGELSAKALEQGLKYIESFVVRRAFNSKVSRDLPKVFSKVARGLSGKKHDRLVIELKRLLAESGWPDDEQFSFCFLSSPIYTAAKTTAKFALVSLERSKPSSKERRLDDHIQIEHIFPQSAKLQDWPAKDMPNLKKNLHVVGNLTLTAYNAKFSNHGFLQKRNGSDGYKKSPYWLTQLAAGNTEWTASAIEVRGKKLLKQALKIWPGPST